MVSSEPGPHPNDAARSPHERQGFSKTVTLRAPGPLVSSVTLTEKLASERFRKTNPSVVHSPVKKHTVRRSCSNESNYIIHFQVKKKLGDSFSEVIIQWSNTNKVMNNDL